MDIPAAPMSPGDGTQHHPEEEASAHRAPQNLGMLLPPLPHSHERVKQGHSRGLLP